jgi:hypothetical protein
MTRHGLAPRFVLIAGLLLAAPAAAIEWTSFEGASRGYPAMRDLAGRTVADGEFAQWIENGRLHVSIAYVGKDRRIEEKAVFRQDKQLAQETWSLRELRDGALYRQFEVNFIKGTASAQKRGEDGKELERWSDDVTVDVGRAFAGFGFTLAVKAVRARLKRGERVELQAVGFTPKPQVVTVDLSFAGTDRLRMAGRVITGERFVVHPKLPWIAQFFVEVPDAQIWLTPAPAAFLRWEGPLAEPSDPVIRVDLLPGGASEAATPVATSGQR